MRLKAVFLAPLFIISTALSAQEHIDEDPSSANNQAEKIDDANATPSAKASPPARGAAHFTLGDGRQGWIDPVPATPENKRKGTTTWRVQLYGNNAESNFHISNGVIVKIREELNKHGIHISEADLHLALATLPLYQVGNHFSIHTLFDSSQVSVTVQSSYGVIGVHLSLSTAITSHVMNMPPYMQLPSPALTTFFYISQSSGSLSVSFSSNNPHLNNHQDTATIHLPPEGYESMIMAAALGTSLVTAPTNLPSASGANSGASHYLLDTGNNQAMDEQGSN